ncbi:MAG: hypothetical protein RSF40_08900 [Oscillospiraceae bacterium]
MNKDKLTEVGIYPQKFNDILGVQIPTEKIYVSNGLVIHLYKHGHTDCIQHLSNLSDIIAHPDYIGVNPNEVGDSVELVKVYNDNILIGLKLDRDVNEGFYLYVSTMYTIQEQKLNRRLHSGRLKKCS